MGDLLAVETVCASDTLGTQKLGLICILGRGLLALGRT